MPLLRDRLIGEVRRRFRPACISCLSTALKAAFDDVMQASREELVLMAVDKSYGTCPECRSPGILLHPPPY